MAINNGMMSSDRHDWETPQRLFDSLNKEFSFTLDAAASADNAKVESYYDETADALSRPWKGNVWLNPPYGREIGHWIKKAYKEAQVNADVVVVLMPARTDTHYFHEYVMKAREVRFIRGRLKFVGAPSPAPFPSMIVIFDMSSGLCEPQFHSANRRGQVLVDQK